ncbi:ribonuclease 3 [Nicotiana attenuata]|uniref:Ribonuclease 3 n=1 Tax=Nicotiana attenuata TaxID=49451 RepID=A0A1J6J835_NICAT|nr:ribonuclease 3 [Nicotiana attenuata]
MKLFFSFTTVPQQVISQSTTYDNMQMVLQWAPTFCGRNNCNNPVPQSFTLHGLWPANSTGNVLHLQRVLVCNLYICMYLQWTTDRQLRTALQKCWYSLIRGRPDYILWKHEWSYHGYCSSQTIKDTGYFWAAVLKYGKNITIAGKEIVNKLQISAGISPSNDKVYKKIAITSALSKILGFNNQVDAVYISCTAKNTTHDILHEIFFCLDKMLGNFIPCPPSPDTRGCDGEDKSSKIIIPTKV